MTKSKTPKQPTTETRDYDLMAEVRNIEAGLLSGPTFHKYDTTANNPNSQQHVNAITAESPLPDIIKFVLGKCVATLPEDIDSLTPKDRIMLWKEYGSYFEPEEVRLSQVPGANIKTVNVKIISDEQ